MHSFKQIVCKVLNNNQDFTHKQAFIQYAKAFICLRCNVIVIAFYISNINNPYTCIGYKITMCYTAFYILFLVV